MKTGFKRGLILLAGLIFSVAAMANEPVPIEPMPVEDRDAFEQEYIACIMSKLGKDCLVSLFSGHFGNPNGNYRIAEINEGFKKLLDSDSIRVVRIIPLEKVTRANYFDSRTYLIEYTNDKVPADRLLVMGAYLVFGRINRFWYVYEFHINNTENFVRRLINLPTIMPHDSSGHDSNDKK
jgi:hypothetical protein